MIGFQADSFANLTQTAGTVIRALIQPVRNAFTRVRKFVYLDAGTAHTLTFLRPLGKTTVASAAAAGQAVVNFTADPGLAAAYGGISNAIAANDLVAIRSSSDGITRLYVVSSVSTLAITMTTNVVVALVAGDEIWNFGITTDTDGRRAAAHPAYLGGAGSAEVSRSGEDGAALVSSISMNEPILFNSNNATNAGRLVQLSYDYATA